MVVQIIYTFFFVLKDFVKQEGIHVLILCWSFRVYEYSALLYLKNSLFYPNVPYACLEANTLICRKYKYGDLRERTGTYLKETT